MKNNHFIRNWIILFGLFGVLFLFGRSYVNSLMGPADPSGKLRAFVVQKGESNSDLADELKKEGLIKSVLGFKIALRFSDKADKIEAGDFKLSPAMSVDELINNLTQGSIDKWVTLIEGWRVEEEADRLSQDLGLDKNEFIKEAKEGYMFPDTYLLNPKMSVSDVVSLLKNTFNKKYTDEMQMKIKENGLSPDQGVVLASIVEREARSDEARRMVASILLKRLKVDMGLNADSTIQYMLGYQSGERSWWKKSITSDDKKINSSYNSYLYKGLPPGPICNPSLSSLKAVADADPSTPYLYYYHDSNGVPHYAKTLDEHNLNVANFP